MSKLSWKKVLQIVGMAISMLLLLVMVVTRCVFLLIRIMISRTLRLFTGQFPLQIQIDITVEPTKIQANGESSTDHIYEEMPQQNHDTYMFMKK